MFKAKDIMVKEVITVSPETKTVQAARMLLEHRINGMPVVDSAGRLVGIICQSDLVAQQKKLTLPSVFNLLDGLIPLSSSKTFDNEVQRIAASTVGQAMTANPATITPETSLEDVASLMVDRKFHTLPVLDHGKVVGIVGKEDVLRTLLPAD